jgi:hypothetical protein
MSMVIEITMTPASWSIVDTRDQSNTRHHHLLKMCDQCCRNGITKHIACDNDLMNLYHNDQDESRCRHDPYHNSSQLPVSDHLARYVLDLDSGIGRCCFQRRRCGNIGNRTTLCRRNSRLYSMIDR